ncbi:MAG: hypothetical protein ABJM43_21795 [Paracoccaceae bacterium]|uniref:hypothetical protein n=1 Tax=Shimia thalassica TaxID=1715693 RepID=UPI00329A0EB1
MKPPRLRARPIAEGTLRNANGEQVAWRDFLWNTGRVSRMWFVDPDSVTEDEIEVRPLDNPKSAGDRT